MTNDKLINKIKNEMQTWLEDTRHWFHQHPELSKQEFKTADKIEELLRSFGFEIDRSLSKTSIIATLKNGEGHTLGIRADIDGLPMQEETGLAFASKNEGIMHACGHDGHITMALGAAKYLAKYKPFKGTIIMIFQCAEEIGFGAQELVDNGLFKKYKFDYIIGLHGMCHSPAIGTAQEGTLSFYPNQDAMMASMNSFEIKLTGRGVHGSAPEWSIDPIPGALELINSIYSIKTRMIPSDKRSVISVCHISTGSGTSPNIIPDWALIKGTFRTVDDQSTKMYKKAIDKFAKFTAKKYNLQLDINQWGSPAVINHQKLNIQIKSLTEKELGKDFVSWSQQVMGGEDFSCYREGAKTVFAFISTGENAPLHNSKYNFSDKTLAYGVAYFVNVAKYLLK
ncbi:M20 metallopeptidase family protein [Mycoplasma sp. 1654_15]|uniref:M20 metallopeptidase family protein n=1 Tax=Mycoplasma sp. 1654_15 TaxID=2725994 RepID=UPI001449CFCC|nr:amidohydrolase [Mycoplasma sp. 1654_15]QJB71132.1 amidohydrolase [Mycoplasma sp. 1654_15]